MLVNEGAMIGNCAPPVRSREALARLAVVVCEKTKEKVAFTSPTMYATYDSQARIFRHKNMFFVFSCWWQKAKVKLDNN